MSPITLGVRQITDETAAAVELLFEDWRDPVWVPRSDILETSADLVRGTEGLLITLSPAGYGLLRGLPQITRGNRTVPTLIPPAGVPDPGSDRTRSTETRHAGDQALRAAGFRIAARPDRGPAVWTRNGRRMSADVAHSLLQRLNQEGRGAVPVNG